MPVFLLFFADFSPIFGISGFSLLWLADAVATLGCVIGVFQAGFVYFGFGGGGLGRGCWIGVGEGLGKAT